MHVSFREGIDWVGCVDFAVRDFHSYEADRGTTYNAYLVRGERTALIDTVKSPMADALLRNIAELIAPERIDLVVCNHAEPDHAGALGAVLRAAPGAAVVCNKRCRAVLERYHDTSGWRFHQVSSGEEISLGGLTLQFLDTPMVHWPESMFTYVPEARTLFSMDAFGQHWATSWRFDDEAPRDTLLDETKKYYANIVMPYGAQVLKCLDVVAGWPIELIATSHGLSWRRHIARVVEAYRGWAAHRPVPKVVVVYDTMWESTAAMAEAIAEGAARGGVETLVLPARQTGLTRIATEVLDAAAVALGSPVLNREMMPAMAAVLNYLEGLRPERKAALAFGSYGWGRGGAESIQAWLDRMAGAAAWRTIRPPIRAQYRPDAAVLSECRAAGESLAAETLQAAEAPEKPPSGDPAGSSRTA